MKRRFDPPQANREQRIRWKKPLLGVVTAVVLLFLAAVCLLQGRRTQIAAVAANGLASFAYLSYLMYLFSYDLKNGADGPHKGVRYYLRHRLSYDWPVYLCILCGCLLAWGSIFAAVNNYKPREKLTVFLCAQEVNDGAQFQEIRAAVEQAGVIQLNMDCYDTGSEKYYTVLAVKGIYDSDVLILDEKSTELFLADGNALELSPAVLADLLGDGRPVELRYTDGGRPAAIKIWDAGEDTGFGLDCLELDGGAYYLIINGRSNHATPYAQGETDAAIRLCRILLSN